jgi:hypothetical protein
LVFFELVGKHGSEVADRVGELGAELFDFSIRLLDCEF